MDEIELVRRCLDGDLEAFDILVQCYRERVYGLALHLLGNPDASEDLAQEAFLRAFTRLALFDPKRDSFAAWLLTLTTRLCLNALKRRMTEERWLTSLETANNEEELTLMDETMPSPEELWWAKERRLIVRRLLMTLPPMQRAAMLLHYGEGMTVQEVAKALETSVGTVKSWLFRGREALRRKLKEVGVV